MHSDTFTTLNPPDSTGSIRVIYRFKIQRITILELSTHNTAKRLTCVISTQSCSLVFTLLLFNSITTPVHDILLKPTDSCSLVSILFFELTERQHTSLIDTLFCKFTLDLSQSLTVLLCALLASLGFKPKTLLTLCLEGILTSEYKVLGEVLLYTGNNFLTFN